MKADERLDAFRTRAADLDGRDLDVYAAHDLEPSEPVLGGGDPRCRIAIFGRDPGRDEIRFREPFIGAGGQQVRRVLHDLEHGGPPPDFAASQAIGRLAFWANTVPYKE